MSANKITRTIRCSIFDRMRFQKMLSSVMNNFPGYIPYDEQNAMDSRGCPKLFIRAYKSREDFANSTTGVVKKYYKPIF